MEISNQRESAFEIIKNERQMIQQRYAEQANLDISSLDFQKERHSIRSFGSKLAQKINPNSLEKMVGLINTAKRILREKTKNNTPNKSDEIKKSNLIVEDIVVGEVSQSKEINNITLNDDNANTIDDDLLPDR